MARFHFDDFKTLEHSPTSPGVLRSKVSEVILSSINPRARVESINPETGEYRVVLQGTLDREDWKTDRW